MQANCSKTNDNVNSDRSHNILIKEEPSCENELYQSSFMFNGDKIRVSCQGSVVDRSLFPEAKLSEISETAAECKKNSSNLETIVKHPHELAYFNEMVSNSKKRKLRGSFDNATKCQKVDTSISQVEFNDLMLSYVINGIVALKCIQSPAFKLFIGSLNLNVNVPSSESLTRLLKQKREIMTHNIRETLNETKFVAISLDCWSTPGNTFLGVSAHWIDNDTLLRQNVVLACQRLKEKCELEITSSVLKVYTRFKIQSKVISSTVDNELISYRPFSVFATTDELDNQIIIQEDLCQVFKQRSQLGQTLWSCECCATLTLLRLITFVDCKVAESRAEYKKRSQNAFNFCRKFWEKISESPQYGVTLVKQINKNIRIVPPDLGNWSSVFDGVKTLNELFGDVNRFPLQFIFFKAGINCLSPQDQEFLKCYENIMKPFSKALNFLKTDGRVYASYLLPTLVGLQDKLSKHLERESSILNPCLCLVEPLLHCIRERFSYAFESETYIAAAILHPKFKCTWTRDEETLTKGKNYINKRLQEMKDIPKDTSEPVSMQSSSTNESSSGYESESFFVRVEKVREKNDPELENYLITEFNDNDKLSEFYQAFPKLKLLFVELCSPVPCSFSTVSHLFSEVNFKDRTHVLCGFDELLETTILLKVNSQFC